MSIAMDNVWSIAIEAYYTLTGSETGLCTAIVDGQNYYLNITNSVQGAKIKFFNGHFYCNDSRVTFSRSEQQQEEEVPPTPAGEQAETQSATYVEETEPGVYEATTIIFTIPESAQSTTEAVETVSEQIVDETTGEVTYKAYYKSVDPQTEEEVWVEIPVLTSQEVEKENEEITVKKTNDDYEVIEDTETHTNTLVLY